MSLKSFDKFCENMILGPENNDYRQKEIYDERQNQVRQKLIIEALTVYSAAVMINTLVMDSVYQWCSGYAAPMLLLAIACYIYWILRCRAKGCLFGVGSHYSTKVTCYLFIFEGIMLGFTMFENLSDDLEEGKSFFINNGVVEERFLLLLVYPLILIIGIIMLVLVKKHVKETEGEKKV